MTDGEAKDRLLLILEKAKSSLETEAPEDVLLIFIEEIDDLWLSMYKQNFFKPPIVGEDVFAESDLDKCIVCGGVFVNELTDEEMIQVQEDKIRYPMMEPVRLCVACCDKLDARMPHKANLN
jgi:hypothetical protein